MNFTFKNQPKETGLRRVGYSKQSVDIKLNKKVCGIIYAPNWMTKDNCYSIRLTVYKTEQYDNSNCVWEWIKLKFKSEDIEECKQFLKDNFEQITSKYKLYFIED